jgi:predicted amino acid racemase
MAPFESFDAEDTSPGERGYRAIVTVGQLDTDVQGLTPLDSRYRWAGASSDLAVLNIGDNPENLKVGDTVKFRPGYGALVRLMLGRYVDKVVVPPIDEYLEGFEDKDRVEVPPVFEEPEGEPAD